MCPLPLNQPLDICMEFEKNLVSHTRTGPYMRIGLS